MKRTLEVLLAPAEFEMLPRRDLSQTTCVVFDILRATTTMITGLANGAEAVIPVREITEALAVKARQTDVLLAGERDGLRIRAAQTGGIDFDLGNSPREFTAERVAGKTIVTTTTNGTRALRACLGAKRVLVGAFANLPALAADLRASPPEWLLIVCSGTQDESALEDSLAAGCLCEHVWGDYAGDQFSDAAQVVRILYQQWRNDLLGGISHGRNGRRLLGHPELRADVALCAQLGTVRSLAEMDRDGVVRSSR